MNLARTDGEFQRGVTLSIVMKLQWHSEVHVSVTADYLWIPLLYEKGNNHRQSEQVQIVQG